MVERRRAIKKPRPAHVRSSSSRRVHHGAGKPRVGAAHRLHAQFYSSEKPCREKKGVCLWAYGATPIAACIVISVRPYHRNPAEPCLVHSLEDSRAYPWYEPVVFRQYALVEPPPRSHHRVRLSGPSLWRHENGWRHAEEGGGDW